MDQYIQSSQDVLFIILAFTILAISIFVCWALFYLVMALRDTRIVTRDIRARVEKVWEVVELVREKLMVGGAMFKLLATGVKELSEYFKKNEGRAKKKNKK